MQSYQGGSSGSNQGRTSDSSRGTQKFRAFLFGIVFRVFPTVFRGLSSPSIEVLSDDEERKEGP